VRRAFAWLLILAGAALTVGGAALVFSESRRELLAAGGGAIVLGLALLALGVVLRPQRRERRAADWRFSPRR
jgi:uncharacterized membrane protein